MSEIEQYARQYAVNVLTGLLDRTCNHCKGADVRTDIEAEKRRIELLIDTEDNQQIPLE